MGRARGQQNAVVGTDRFAAVLGARRGRDHRDHQLDALSPSEDAKELLNQLTDQLLRSKFRETADTLDAHVEQRSRPLLRALTKNYAIFALAYCSSQDPVKELEVVLYNVGAQYQYCRRIFRVHLSQKMHLMRPSDDPATDHSGETLCHQKMDPKWYPALRGDWKKEQNRKGTHCCGMCKANLPEDEDSPEPEILEEAPQPLLFGVREETINSANDLAVAAVSAHLDEHGRVPRDHELNRVVTAAAWRAWRDDAAVQIAAGKSSISRPELTDPTHWAALIDAARENKWNRASLEHAIAGAPLNSSGYAERHSA